MELPQAAVDAAADAIERELLSGTLYDTHMDSDAALAQVALAAAAPHIIAAERERICAWLDEIAAAATEDTVTRAAGDRDPLVVAILAPAVTTAIRNSMTQIADLLRNPEATTTGGP